jgi:GNAT superfamily N-acetyltransferase
MSFQVRLATRNDTLALTAFVLSANTGLDRYATDLDIGCGNLFYNSAVVAVIGLEIVGAAVDLPCARDRAWRIARVLVAPEHRRRGIGKALVEWLVAGARSETVTAELPMFEPEGAREFLRAAGFLPASADPRERRFYRQVVSDQREDASLGETGAAA